MNIRPRNKRLCVLVAVCLLFTAVGPIASAAQTEEKGTALGRASAVADMQAAGESLEYSAYLEQNAAAPIYEGPPLILSAADAICEEGSVQEWEGETAAVLPVGGCVTWEIPTIEEGLYAIRLRYASQMDAGSGYTAEVLLNGTAVNRQASLLSFSKRWIQPADALASTGRFQLDQFGNELVPVQEEAPGWQSCYLTDSEGKYEDVLLFRLQTGDRLTLHVKKSATAIASLALTAMEKPPAYAQKREEYQKAGYPALAGEATIIQAELPLSTSDSSLLPTSDHMSVATQPQDAMHTLQNTIGQEYWQYAGQTITWEFTVPETGLYKIDLRYRQNYQRGVRVGRRFRLDGDVPFAELNRYTFEFSDTWEIEELGNGGEPYLFYLEAGESHTLSMEVVLAYPALIRKMESMLKELNVFYRQVLMIVGTDPDPYRDYMLDSTIPDFESSLRQYEETLRRLLEELYASGFEKGGSIVAAEEVADTLTSFLEKPNDIPVRLSAFSDSLAALGSWLSELSCQPLELDYLAFVPAEAETLNAGGGFFQSIGYGFQVFFASFFGDYSSISADESREALTVWVNSGRDQAQVIKRLVSSSFTSRYGIPVNLSLVLQGLVPATLSGKGPDIILGVSSTDAVNLAVRDALVDLRVFQEEEDSASFETVRTWFQPTSLDLYTYEKEVYALPLEDQINMMFVRTDILRELGLEAPETWEELNNTISILARNYLEVGIPTNPGAGITANLAQAGQGAVNESVFQTLLFQQGESYYEDGWSKTGFDSQAAIAAFTQWTDYFTKYTLPTDYDLFSRFRSGQMPLALVSYIFYNILSAGAPEIRGLWEMFPVPGTVKEDGTLDQSVAGGSTAIALFAKTRNKEDGWKFLQWYVSAETQAAYARQIESILGPSGRFDPANVEALKEIGWEEGIEEQILNQWSQMKMVPMTPVSYYLSRSISNAFRKVTYSYTEPRETLNRYNREINKEIARKRANLGLS